MKNFLYWCCVFTIVAGVAVVGVDLMTALVELATAVVVFFQTI
jgi:hypothetical protein